LKPEVKRLEQMVSNFVKQAKVRSFYDNRRNMVNKLLTSNKLNVSYFQVFGSKCYVLQKRSKSSKFAPKVYEGFLLGYDSNSHAYHVFNVTTGCIETTCDVVFDETNGSQKK
jgi:hypothetical protein